MHELADEYDLPHVVKQGLKATAEMHKYAYCNLMRMHGAVVEAAAPIKSKHHPIV